MDRAEFQRILGKTFFPTLKAAGFTGSGGTRRRVRGPIINVVNIQGSQWGGGFYVNMGVHVAGLPGPGGTPPTDRPTEHQCIVRRRLDPSAELGRGMWPSGATEEEATAITTRLSVAFTTMGGLFFGEYSRWPDDFVALVRAALEGQVLPVVAPDVIRLARRLEMFDEARTLAGRALARMPAGDTALRAELELIVAEG